jgi:hypothetical protein
VSGQSAVVRSAAGARSRTRLPTSWSGPTTWRSLIGLLLAGRLAVLVAGLLGAQAAHPASAWHLFDPTRLSQGFGPVGNLLAGPAIRWDALWYLHIAAHGYSGTGTAIFFPLYPLLIRVAGTVIGSAAVAAALISLVAFALALLFLYRLTELELGACAARATLVLLGLAPLSFFFTAAYTESLFLALAVGTAYAARRQRWALAGLLGGLAAATRVSGVLLVLLVLLPARDAERRPGLELRRAWMLLVPAGLAAYLVFLASSGRGLLAPFLGQASAAHGHQFVGPLVAVWRAFGAAGRATAGILGGSQPVLEPHSLAAPFAPGAESIYLLVVLLTAVGALAVCFRRLPQAYGLFALMALLVAISSPVAGQPLKSLDRYALTIFPLWMAAASWLAEKRLLVPVLAIGVPLLAFFSFQFAAWTFVA